MAALKNPECSQCGNCNTFRADLNVRPVVYTCPACWSIFTHTKSAPGPSKRSIRASLCRRFDQIAADFYHFVNDLRAVEGLGIFLDEDLENAIFGLDNTVQDVLINCHLRPPASERRKVPKVTLNELQKLRRIRWWQQEKEAEELKQQIRASDHPKQERNQ